MTQADEYREAYVETGDLQSAATLVLAAAVDRVASNLAALGNGNAATEFGAIEALGIVLRDGLQSVSCAIADAAPQ